MRLALKLGIVVFVGACAVSSCVFPYYMQAIGGQVSLLRQRIPIETVLQDQSFDTSTRRRLELVIEIRSFAMNELGLPESESYTSYVDLGRDYVVWNVVAAEEFSIEPETWCFPVAGCVSYRGYFDRDKAAAFADRLSQRGFDIFTGGSAAYSTLGHFDDPVLNTMLTGPDFNIAATLFHELAHQRLYVKDDTELSESFATAVEQFAVEEWLKSRNETAELTLYLARLKRQRDFADLVSRQRERLTEVFAAAENAATMRLNKANAFELMRLEYESLKSAWGGVGDYDRWFGGDLNNASLVAVTSYQLWVPGLRSRIDTVGLQAFFSEVEALVAKEPSERTEVLESWNRASAATAFANEGQFIDAVR
jgi:predicted aminopeptidase